jgi:hypothetical protein
MPVTFSMARSVWSSTLLLNLPRIGIDYYREDRLSKGKRGCGTVPLIPTAAHVLDEYLATVAPKKYVFETFRGDLADLDYMAREVIRPKVREAGLPWYGFARIPAGTCHQSARAGGR